MWTAWLWEATSFKAHEDMESREVRPGCGASNSQPLLILHQMLPHCYRDKTCYGLAYTSYTGKTVCPTLRGLIGEDQQKKLDASEILKKDLLSSIHVWITKDWISAGSLLTFLTSSPDFRARLPFSAAQSSLILASPRQRREMCIKLPPFPESGVGIPASAAFSHSGWLALNFSPASTIWLLN